MKDELWLFLENGVLSVATGQTLNSRGWNYLKRERLADALRVLSLKERLLFPGLIDHHLKGLLMVKMDLKPVVQSMCKGNPAGATMTHFGLFFMQKI